MVLEESTQKLTNPDLGKLQTDRNEPGSYVRIRQRVGNHPGKAPRLVSDAVSGTPTSRCELTCGTVDSERTGNGCEREN